MSRLSPTSDIDTLGHPTLIDASRIWSIFYVGGYDLLLARLRRDVHNSTREQFMTAVRADLHTRCTLAADHRGQRRVVFEPRLVRIVGPSPTLFLAVRCEVSVYPFCA